MTLLTAPYLEQQARWPQQGRHILAQYTDTTVVVYQAFHPGIGRFAATHGHFGDGFSLERTSWIKPNFLWMMYRSQWGTAAGQEVILAITLQQSAFMHILAQAVHSTYTDRYADHVDWKRQLDASDVVMQWDPDHDPGGGRLERRAVQLGLRRETLAAYAQESIVAITDISAFVAQQRAVVLSERYDDLLTPSETVYPITDPLLTQRLTISPHQ